MRKTRPQSSLILAALMMLSLTGCFFISHDRTQTPEMNGLTGHKFSTAQDAALVQDACIPDYKAKSCQQLQILGGFYFARGGDRGWHQVRVPTNPELLTAAITAGAKLTPVPRGTSLTIVQIESRSLGQERRCWVIYAKLDMLPANTVAEIPGCFQWAPESSPVWFEPQKLPTKKYEPVQYDYEKQAPSADPAMLIPAN